MKSFCKILMCIIVLTGASNLALADTIYLNNGSVLNGATVIEDNGVNTTVRLSNGSVITYASTDINRIASSDKEIVNPRESGIDSSHKDYSSFRSGFFFAVEARSGISMNFGKNDKNIGFAEVNIVGGYRFNQYLRVGLGLGPRYYIKSSNLRYAASDWAMPLYLNVRGNFIPQDYRQIVPYYSFDIGGTFPDGFMMRPTIGIRVGEPRSAFLLGLSYVGQNLRSSEVTTDGQLKVTRNFTSMVAITLGYEF